MDKTKSPQKVYDDSSLIELVDMCRGSFKHRKSLLECSKDDILVSTLHYTLTTSGITLTHKATIRHNISHAGSLALFEIEEFLRYLVKNYFSELFSNRVFFTKATYKLNSDLVRRECVLSIKGKRDEIPARFPFIFKAYLTTRHQEVFFQGIPKSMEEWKTTKNDMTRAVFIFSQGIIREFVINNNLKLLPQGFHYGTKHRDAEEVLVGFEPLYLAGTNPKSREKAIKTMITVRVEGKWRVMEGRWSLPIDH